MNILVPVKMVPDLVEELLIDPSGRMLDMMYLRMILNEFDDHAIEQAILLKEAHGGRVVVLAAGLDGVDDALFTASAKGADKLFRLAGDFEGEHSPGYPGNHALARQLAPLLLDMHPDLVLTGVQANNDLDGSLGPLLAAQMDLPYVGYVAGVEMLSGDGRQCVTVRKEYPGGLVGEMAVEIPAVLGIQASSEPPRYVAFNKIRNAMKSAVIEEIELSSFDLAGGIAIDSLTHPDTGEGAELLTGNPHEIAEKISAILEQTGLL